MANSRRTFLRTRGSACSAVVALVAALLGSVLLIPSAVAAPAPAERAGTTSSWTDLIGRLWADQVIRGMSTQEKVGQLFSTHVYGSDANTPDANNTKEFGVATAAEVVRKYHLGGVLYFSWAHNVDTPTQAAGLSNGLQRAAIGSGARVPLLMSIDQEGGLVTRMLEPATQTPGSMAIGATRDQRAARDLAAIQGRELAAVGVRQNFAPDSDVNVNPANPIIGVRSFGSDPTAVSSMVAAQIAGYQRDAGISSAVKHFPGHGDTTVDSHTGIPVITHTRAEWDRIDKPPFVAAIKAGVDVIMTAHIIVPALDPSGDPSTLSKSIITDILRGELGYRGVVVTDALNMQGVREKYGDDRVPVLALKAGVDILLDPPNLDVAYNGVLDAVASGEITQQRLDESLRRVLLLKWRNGTALHPFVDPRRVDRVVGTEASLERVAQVTDSSITLLRNETGVLPLAPAGEKILVTGYNATSRQTVADGFAARGATASVAPVGTNPTDAEIGAAVAAARGQDAALVLTYNTSSYAGQTKLVKALQDSGVPVIAVATRNPYDIASHPEATTALATYGTKTVSLQSVLRVITGEVRPTGKLPVSIPASDGSTLYPIGYGLSW